MPQPSSAIFQEFVENSCDLASLLLRDHVWTVSLRRVSVGGAAIAFRFLPCGCGRRTLASTPPVRADLLVQEFFPSGVASAPFPLALWPWPFKTQPLCFVFLPLTTLLCSFCCCSCACALKPGSQHHFHFLSQTTRVSAADWPRRQNRNGFEGYAIR